jgi:hypothetical protein
VISVGYFVGAFVLGLTVGRFVGALVLGRLVGLLVGLVVIVCAVSEVAVWTLGTCWISLSSPINSMEVVIVRRRRS